MVALVTPGGVEVSVREEQVEHLLSVGYERYEPKPAPKRRAPRKAQKPQEKK